mmetsp:Transcript_37078/g.52376  ORF Transcript_37078/g.52376 Transcript_37078/m.52376 type:complete len:200 (+) Transcript_37078:567-1166(+)
MIPINAFDGTAVLMLIIFQRESLTEEIMLGMDHFAEVIEHNNDEEFDRLNSGGVGKRFPGGPVCNFKGKTIPCMYACSPSGGVTGDILLSLLKRLDELEVTNRTDGKSPHMELDAHDTRFVLPFLEYITQQILSQSSTLRGDQASGIQKTGENHWHREGGFLSLTTFCWIPKSLQPNQKKRRKTVMRHKQLSSLLRPKR